MQKCFFFSFGGDTACGWAGAIRGTIGGILEAANGNGGARSWLVFHRNIRGSRLPSVLSHMMNRALLWWQSVGLWVYKVIPGYSNPTPCNRAPDLPFSTRIILLVL